jgi:hypothetical protein
MGNLATRPGVRRNHPDAATASPTPPATQAGRHRRRFCGFVGKSSFTKIAGVVNKSTGVDKLTATLIQLSGCVHRVGSHSFLPDLSLLLGFKGDQGADLFFKNWLDFTRGA